MLGVASRGFRRRSGGVLPCLWCALCPRPLCTLRVASTPWSEATGGTAEPPRRQASCVRALAALARLQRAARRGLRGVRGVVSQSPRRPVWLPHPPGPGPRTWWWPVPCPSPFCSLPASGLRAPSVGGTGGLSQLPIEVAACFPSRAWELDPLQVPGRPVPKGFQADLPENPQHRLCFQGGGWGGRPRAFVLSRRLSRLRNTRPRRGP